MLCKGAGRLTGTLRFTRPTWTLLPGRSG